MAENEGTTAKVERELVILQWRRRTPEHTLDETTNKWVKGTTKSVKQGNYLLYLPKSTLDYLNLTAATAATEAADPTPPKPIKVKGHNRTQYSAIDGTEGKVIPVVDFERGGQRKGGKPKIKSVIITTDKKTTAGNIRTLRLPFPDFFTTWMMLQATGSLLANAQADRKPMYLKLSSSGAKYVIPYSTTAGLFPGFDDGAWVAPTKQAELGGEEGGDPIPANAPVVKALGGDKDANKPVKSGG